MSISTAAAAAYRAGRRASMRPGHDLERDEARTGHAYGR